MVVFCFLDFGFVVGCDFGFVVGCGGGGGGGVDDDVGDGCDERWERTAEMGKREKLSERRSQMR